MTDIGEMVARQSAALRTLGQAMRRYAGQSEGRAAKNIHGWADQIVQTGDDLAMAFEFGPVEDLQSLWLTAWRVGFANSSETVLGTGRSLDRWSHPAIDRCAHDVLEIGTMFASDVLEWTGQA